MPGLRGLADDHDGTAQPGPGDQAAEQAGQPVWRNRLPSFLDEPDEGVEQGGSGIGGQHAGGHAVQVDAAEDQQPGGQRQHRPGEAEAGADQGAPVTAATYTPRPSSSSDRIGSTISRSLMTR